MPKIREETRDKRESEEQLQVRVIRWWDTVCAKYGAEPYELMHIPNGLIKQSAIRKVKALGIRKGYPDLFLAIPNEFHHGLFIELKRWDRAPVTGLSMDQRKIVRSLTFRNYATAVCNDYEEICRIILAYMESKL